MIFDWMQGDNVSGGGSCDYPTEANVLEGVQFGSGTYTGTLKKYSVSTDANDPRRQRIMDVLETRLATILTTNGYKTNIGSNVQSWKDTPWESGGLPCVEIRDTEESVDNSAINEWWHSLEVEIRVFTTGSAADDSLRLAEADVIQAMGTDREVSTLAEDTIKSADPVPIEVVHGGKKYFGSMLRFTVEYSTDPFSAY